MIPSLLVSIAGAIVVTRASSQSSLGTDMGEQLLGRSRPLWIGAAVMFCLALVPGLPKLSFIVMAAGVALLAKRAGRKQTVVAEAKVAAQAEPDNKHPVGDIADALPLLDDLSLEVGYGLVPIVDTRQGGQLLARVRALRKHLAQQLGFIVPAVHITDNLRLKPHEYVICLRGIEVARWEMQADRLLAISSSNDEPELPGIQTREPAFGVGARWISPATRDRAVAAGYAVVDQTSVLATHLAEVIRQNAHELLTRQETKRLLDRLGESHPKLADELVPKLVSLGEVQRVLQQLLREQVSIRDLGTILESMVETAAISKNPVLLVESARQSLSRALVKPLLSADGTLRVLALDAEIEQELSRAFDPQASSPAQLPLQPPFARRLLEGIKRLAGDQLALASPVLLCPTPARFHLRRLLEPFVPKLVVLSPGEVPPAVPVQTLGMVR
jgi:flagellar biosynthesis protein FlhA